MTKELLTISVILFITISTIFAGPAPSTNCGSSSTYLASTLSLQFYLLFHSIFTVSCFFHHICLTLDVAAYPLSTFTLDSIIHGGLNRTFRVYLPSGYQSSTPLPLVFMFHGGGGSSLQFIAGSNMKNVRCGVVVVCCGCCVALWCVVLCCIAWCGVLCCVVLCCGAVCCMVFTLFSKSRVFVIQTRKLLA